MRNLVLAGLATALASTASSQAISGEDAQPITPPVPEYPTLAAAWGIEGYCEVRFNVDEQGNPFSLRTACTQPIFCHEAKRAVSRVKFQPAIVDGISRVRENVIYPLEFQLGSMDPETGEWLADEEPDINRHTLKLCRKIAVS